MADALVDRLVELGLYELLRLRLVNVYTVPAPAAGADFTFKVPAGVVWELLAVRMTLNTSAVVANRIARVAAVNGDGLVVARWSGTRNQTAGTIVPYTFAAGYGDHVDNVDSCYSLPSPPYTLLSGWSVQSTIAAIDVGDTLTAIFLAVREWSVQQVEVQAEWLRSHYATAVQVPEEG